MVPGGALASIVLNSLRGLVVLQEHLSGTWITVTPEFPEYSLASLCIFHYCFCTGEGSQHRRRRWAIRVPQNLRLRADPRAEKVGKLLRASLYGGIRNDGLICEAGVYSLVVLQAPICRNVTLQENQGASVL